MQKEIQLLQDKLSFELSERDLELNVALLALIAKGHLLIEDLPGTGKTSLAKFLALVFDLSFARVQFTSDTLPGDILGYTLFSTKTESFQFKPGPIFNSFLLADELNRGNPKTQSAFLEAMEESAVTVDSMTRPLPKPFFVIATQNPFESVGTYPLPESHLDRFHLSLSMRPLSTQAEKELLFKQNTRPTRVAESIEKNLKPWLERAWQEAPKLPISSVVADYLHSLITEGRENGFFISTRSLLHLAELVRAHAWMNGRNSVYPDDVKFVFPYAVAHRHKSERRVAQAYEMATHLVSKVAVPL
jgi:MoxR-like ATPase